MKLKKFTIFGERHTGTKYLKKILQNNLDLDFTNEYGHKHPFIEGIEPRGLINTTTDLEKTKSIFDSDDTWFFVTVRNPFDWIGAMYNKPYAMKEFNKENIFSFMKSKYIAYEYEQPVHNLWKKKKEEPYYFMEEADNILQLRNLKNQHFYNLRNFVKKYSIIRLEHFQKDIEKELNKVINFFDYRKPVNYNLNNEEISFIKNNLDNDIDNLYYL